MSITQAPPVGAAAELPTQPKAPRFLIVGSPNVGKSALFNRLTGRYAAVSNYPGTTVEVFSGRSKLFGESAEVVDTPGMYSLSPLTEEERVARDMLFASRADAVLHVLDAKNITRMLGLTLYLAEAGLPVVLVLNMADEAEALGIRIDCTRLEAALGLPVVATVATSGRGIEELIRRVKERTSAPALAPAPVLKLSGPVAETAAAIESRLSGRRGLSPRMRALLLLQEDADERRMLSLELGDEKASEVLALAAKAGGEGGSSHEALAVAVRERVDQLLHGAVAFPPQGRTSLREKLSQFCMSPWSGLPLMAVVLYVGLYQFVGNFGAGWCVNSIENFFKEYVSGWVNTTATSLCRFWPPLADLFAGDYGIITLGLRYAIAIILPVVGTFFLAFSLLEDSGYLPRLAMLIDRVFKKIGLNGRAVIPMVLGFGCATMATLVTRTLQTRRERTIATILLALAVPCSAQMGLILALLAGHPGALAVWAGVVLGIFLLTGTLAAKIMPGEPPSFYMELPPLRLPRLGNVLTKTWTRVVWYLREVLPMFLAASVLIWIGRVTGLFQIITGGLGSVLATMGLPREAAASFLFGFFRRDYGAAGLYDLHNQGMLTDNQLVVAAVTLTLFLPCIAQLLVMRKERGLPMTLLVSAFVALVAYGAGLAVHLTLTFLGVRL